MYVWCDFFLIFLNYLKYILSVNFILSLYNKIFVSLLYFILVTFFIYPL